MGIMGLFKRAKAAAEEAVKAVAEKATRTPNTLAGNKEENKLQPTPTSKKPTPTSGQPTPPTIGGRRRRRKTNKKMRTSKRKARRSSKSSSRKSKSSSKKRRKQTTTSIRTINTNTQHTRRK